MSKVLCFGETLLRFSPELGGEWVRRATMPVYIGGAELNTATALAGWGVPVSYLTALPQHALAEEVVQEISRREVNTSSIVRSGERIGTYYLPQGADLKHTGVIYDRAHSSFAALRPGKIDWQRLFDGITWFHFSAINPALNANIAAVCAEALLVASKKNITISVDLNYRAKLWQYGQLPVDVMPELVQYCDVVMGNIWAADKMLGVGIPTITAEDKNGYVAAAQIVSEAIKSKFSQCKQVANTFRFDEGNGIRYYAALHDQDKMFVARTFQSATIADKVGSGDTFMAGLIYGNYSRMSPQAAIDFATAAAFNKLFIHGDATTASVDDIRQASMKYA